ncbi:MAG: N-acetylglucosamine-6-phosphate deacetylase [Firmicutes bacterium]|nr:N-acetylglucosamine-6-phosphate deacetylase [Bacillota bacterium]
MKAIVNATVIGQGQAWPGYAIVFDQRIRAVGPQALVQNWPVDELIDADGLIVAPGLIDIHIHGCGGSETMDATPEALETMATCLAQYGVTSFVPTTMTAEWEQVEKAITNVRQLQGNSRAGARILGVHLEGPFLNPEFKGAHDAQHLALPDFQLIVDYLDVIRIITLAPEMEGSATFLEHLKAYPQIVAAIGHSGAGYETVTWAMEQGIRHTTHLFNAMAPFHHREPGVIGAVLALGLSAELIADNLHVHPGLYSLLLKTHGPAGLILVSDAMRAAGLGDGEYDFGGQGVRVRDGAARLPSGTLAGSVLTLNRAVINFQRATGCPLAEAIAMASRNPARLLGLHQHIGDLAVGLEADIIIMDGNGQVHRTFIGGQG